MRRADAVATCVATTDDEHVLSFGSDSFVLPKFHSCQHSVLLGKHFESEVNTMQFTTRHFQIACCGCACGNDEGGEIGVFSEFGELGDFSIILELDSFFLKNRDAAVYEGFVQFEVWNAVAE